MIEIFSIIVLLVTNLLRKDARSKRSPSDSTFLISQVSAEPFPPRLVAVAPPRLQRKIGRVSVNGSLPTEGNLSTEVLSLDVMLVADLSDLQIIKSILRD